MRTTHLLIALFAAVFWCDTARADVPARVELTIEVEARGMKVGEGRDVFEHDGKRYTVRTEAKTVGVARLIKRMDEKRESRGAITERGLRPE
ncbi:MAG: hypothetical protein KIT73_19575, partial [Burkholderiales bacterium]|nr:hypothetical protein [Burkholderiales bacterium]